MPVIRSSKQASYAASVKELLIDQLVKELLQEGTREGPVIFEIPTQDPRMIDVIVVWDSWKGIPPAERMEIIREAYSRYAGSLEESLRGVDMPAERRALPTVAIPIGATVVEAVNDNLLPYRIIGTGRDKVLVRQAMIEEGAIEIPGLTDGYVLSFPTKLLADEVYDRLLKTYPSGHWAKHYY